MPKFERAVVTMKDGRVETFGDSQRQVFNEIENGCGYEFSRYIKNYVEALEYEADYNRAKINSDLDCYESQLEEYRDTLQEISELVDLYVHKLKNGEEKFSRQRVIPLLEQISGIINHQI